MYPGEKKPPTVKRNGIVPSSREIFIVILLGIAGLLGTFQYLLNDLKITGFKKELWLVKSDSLRINKAQKLDTIVDTLVVIYHPRTAYKPATTNHENWTKKPRQSLSVSRDGNPFSFSNIYFAYNSVLLVWMAIFSILVACSLAVFPVILSAIKHVVKIFALTRRDVVMVSMITVVIGVLLYFMQHIQYLKKPTEVLDQLGAMLKHPLWLDALSLSA